jgi:hypothetical protein
LTARVQLHDTWEVGQERRPADEVDVDPELVG